MIDRAPRPFPTGGLALLLGIYWLALWIGTHLPAEHLPGAIDAWDKVVHFLAYGGLATLLATTVCVCGARLSWRLCLLLAAVLAIHGALDEWTQGWVPGRQPDRWDFLADVLGATTGLTLVAWTAYGWRRPFRKPGHLRSGPHCLEPASKVEFAVSPCPSDGET